MSRRLRLTWLASALVGMTAHAQISCPPGQAGVWTGAWICAPVQSAPAYGHSGPTRQQQIEAIMSGATQGEMVNPLQGRINVMASALEAQALGGQRLQAALDADPRLRELAKGRWEHFDAGRGQGTQPGSTCAAAYLELRGAVLLSEAGGGFKEAIMTFVGVSIPRPAQPSKLTVTLDQDDGKPQQVKALNFAVAGSSSLGALSFEVPTMALLLDTMEDRQSFEIRIGSKSVAQLQWKGGSQARDQLRRCVVARR